MYICARERELGLEKKIAVFISRWLLVPSRSERGEAPKPHTSYIYRLSYRLVRLWFNFALCRPLFSLPPLIFLPMKEHTVSRYTRHDARKGETENALPFSLACAFSLSIFINNVYFFFFFFNPPGLNFS